MKIFQLIALSALTIIALSGCTSVLGTPLQGKWERGTTKDGTTQQEILEFTGDKLTLKVKSDISGNSAEIIAQGDYKSTEKDGIYTIQPSNLKIDINASDEIKPFIEANRQSLEDELKKEFKVKLNGDKTEISVISSDGTVDGDAYKKAK